MVPLPTSCQVRVTSDPILRTAGPPAHTHVPGESGVGHGPRMVAQTPRVASTAATETQRFAPAGYDDGDDRHPRHVPRLRRREGRRRGRARRARVPRGRPAGRRGRGPGRLVERQLQGRPGDARRRQGRADQPAHPRHRPGRRGRRELRPGRSTSGRPSSPMATSWASRATAATPSTSACRPAGSCPCRPACRRATRCRSGRRVSPRRCPWPRSRSAVWTRPTGRSWSPVRRVASAGRRSRSWPIAATRSGPRPASPTRRRGCWRWVRPGSCPATR